MNITFVKRNIDSFFRLFYDKSHLAIMERDLSLLKVGKVSSRFNVDRKVYHRDFPEEKFSKYFSHNYDGLKDLFSQDLYCMAAEINGDVVGYMWVATSDYYEKGLNYLFKVKKNQIYQFAGELHPNFCRSSISRDGLNFTWKYFSDKGFNSVYCYVNQYNPFSINLHKRTGFMPTNKKIIYTRILTRFKRSVSADM